MLFDDLTVDRRKNGLVLANFGDQWSVVTGRENLVKS
jgi:hypothetical protein